MTEEQVAIEAALAAGRVLAEARDVRAAGGGLGVRHKGAVDLVTEYDLRCEAAIREVLARHTPDVPVYGEEGGGAADARTRWVVDPIDGTTNFVHGFPYFAVSIGLEVDGAPTVGVVLDGVRGTVFRATTGKGAWADDQRIRVSGARTLDEALCATGFAYDRRTRAAFYLRFVAAALEHTQGIRRAGAAALDLSMVAAGAIDLYWEFNLSWWDVAAGTVLVQEAGGRVDPIPGRTRNDPVATNGWLHDLWMEQMERLLEEGT
ncbi:MAG: inositol monophosphatase family protein [Myxococcota bacterium]